MTPKQNPFPRHPLPLYLVRLDRPTPFRGRTLEPETYVCDHVTLSMLSSYAVPASVRTLRIEDEAWPDDGDGGMTLVMPGVHGDLLMLTSLRVDRDDDLQVACLPEYAGILKGSGLETVDLPCIYDPTRDYVNLSHITERPEVLGQTFTDGLYEMGFQVHDSLYYAVSPGEKEFAKLAWPRERKAVRIAYQPFASSRVRNYPHMGQLLTAMDKAFDPMPEVLLLCDEMLAIPEGVRHRVKQTADFHCDIRQAAAMMAECDILVCPDSVFQHIAGAIGLRTVALFGSFHWTERVLNKDRVFALQGHAECAPCRHHAGSTQGASHPDDHRCTVPKTGFCQAMASIDPERVAREMKRLLEERP